MATSTDKETLTLLLFASASSYAGTESLHLPAPTTLGAIFQTLETRFPGFLAKILSGAAVTLNLEYVDVSFPEVEPGREAEMALGLGLMWDEWNASLEGWRTPVKAGDEVGVIPPVSSG